MKREPTWGLRIQKADNGYICSYDEMLDSGVVRKNYIAVEDRDGGETECMQRLLWEVLEHFAVYKGISVELTNEDQ